MKEAITALFANDDAGLETTIAKVTDRAADIRRKLRPAILGYLEKAGLTAPAAGSDAEAVAEAEKRLALPKPGKAFDQLTMDEIIKVLLDHPNAPKLNKASGVTELRGLLERVRDVRNNLAHFRGELTGEERRLIVVAAEWLEQNLPTPAPPTPAVVPVVVPVFPLVTQTTLTHEEGDDDAPRGTYAALSAHLKSQPATTTAADDISGNRASSRERVAAICFRLSRVVGKRSDKTTVCGMAGRRLVIDCDQQLYERKQEVEEIVGEPLSWELRKDKRACRIAVYTPARIELAAENSALFDWATARAVSFHRAFASHFAQS